MELLSSLSEATANSWEQLMAMPFHFVYSTFNAIKKRREEEAKQYKEQEKQSHQKGTPSVPNMGSINSIMGKAKGQMPHVPGGMPRVPR